MVLTDFRIEITDAKPRQAMLAGEVLDDADEPVDPAIAAGVGGRADDHRHAEPVCPQQHVLEIVPLPLHRARRHVRAERPRTDIARPGIGADQVGRAVEPDLKARRLDRRKAEMPVGAQDAQRRPGRCQRAPIPRREFPELRPPYRNCAILGITQATAGAARQSDLSRTAIHKQLDAIDVAAIVGSQEHRRLAEIVRRADPAERN